ncbi:hypothetical protein GRJ2_000962200 [Grus japonensis]|uniref:Reverse transcriptase domain-containing protein n=1 Tax=Grus japonensis TaxID=30415 RepID=A0ABC9WHN0_GRUJA
MCDGNSVRDPRRAISEMRRAVDVSKWIRWAATSVVSTGEHLVMTMIINCIVYLDFSKTFATVSHKILIEKLLMHGLGDQMVR